MGGREREDDVLAVARDDHQRAGTDPLEHVVRLHRADRDALDDPVEVGPGRDHPAAHALEDHAQRRVRQDRPVRQHAEQRDPVPAEAAPQRVLDARLLVDPDLVDDRPGDPDAVRGEMRGVEDDLVDRAADAALGHDHRRRAEHPRDDGVRQPDHRADAGVARALDQQDVVVRELALRGHDPGAEVLDHLARDVRLGEPARDVDRAHHRVRLRQVEDRAHEDGVLVGGVAVVDHGALADGLDEPGVEAAPPEPVDEPQRGGRLAAVLPGRGEVELAHGRGAAGQPREAVLRSTSWTASRRRVRDSSSTPSGSRYGPRRSRMSVDEPHEHGGVRDEELRLVVVADHRQAALEDPSLLDVGDLGREVVALDPVRVVEEVERVVDREAEPGAPRDEALVDLGRDADLGDLVEHLRCDGQEADERRARPRAEHHLQAALEGEHLGVEPRAGDDVGQQVLDVVQAARVVEGVGEVEDLLLEEELLLVVKHGADGNRGSAAGRRCARCYPSAEQLPPERLPKPCEYASSRPAALADEHLTRAYGFAVPAGITGGLGAMVLVTATVTTDPLARAARSSCASPVAS